MNEAEVLSNIRGYDLWEIKDYPLTKKEAELIISVLERDCRVGKPCYCLYLDIDACPTKWIYYRYPVGDISVLEEVYIDSDDTWYPINDENAPVFFTEKEAKEECEKRNAALAKEELPNEVRRRG